MDKSRDDKEINEGFCGACISIPVALAGAGIAGYGATGSKKRYKTQKKIAFWSGLVVVLISLSIAVYYMWIKKDCVGCHK
jgi:hypothetical protein